VRATYLLICLFLLSSALCAEDIQLKDGSKITGRITAVDGDTFRVKTAYGEIQVPRSQIVTIHFAENDTKKEQGSEDASAVQPIDESLDGVHYSNRTAHFQVDVPAGWTISPELRKSSEIVAALISADQAHFFLVTPEKYSGSLSTYRVLAETQYQARFQDYQKLSESEVKLDGRNGLRLVWKGKPQGQNAILKFVVYIIPYDNQMVRLSLFTLEPLFDESEPIFAKIAASYHSTSDKPIAKLSRPASSLVSK